jgi:hypothetical protein
LQRQVPLTHTPEPGSQAGWQAAKPQSGPEKPVWQMQVPALHEPWPEQPLGQAVVAAAMG